VRGAVGPGTESGAGCPRKCLAVLVGRTADWLGRVENDRAAPDRLSAVRSLAEALGVPVFDLVGEEDAEAPSTRRDGDVARIRAVLTDYRCLILLPPGFQRAVEQPDLLELRREVEAVTAAYQCFRYHRVLRSLPDLLLCAHTAVRVLQGKELLQAEQLSALSAQAAAVILTELGETDPAWIAAERGLQAAQRSANTLVIGSLLRSGVHSLHSCGQGATSVETAEQAASCLRERWTGRPPESSPFTELSCPPVPLPQHARETAGLPVTTWKSPSGWLWDWGRPWRPVDVFRTGKCRCPPCGGR